MPCKHGFVKSTCGWLTAYATIIGWEAFLFGSVEGVLQNEIIDKLNNNETAWGDRAKAATQGVITNKLVNGLTALYGGSKAAWFYFKARIEAAAIGYQLASE